MAQLINPTNEIICEYLKKFERKERYYLADKAILKLFKKFPTNNELEDILVKISVINDLYSTNIFGTFIMAKHIQQLQIDTGLELGDPTIVKSIATGHGILKPNGGGDRNFYSFATKYCNWHNQDAYPIYDRFVYKILIAYRKQDEFSKFNVEDLKEFPRFKQIMLEFKQRYTLTQHSLKEIDKFLWIYGQEKFPNNYTK